MSKSSSRITRSTTLKATWFLWWRWSGLALLFTFALFALFDLLELDPDRWSGVAVGLGFVAHMLLFGPFAVRAFLKRQSRELAEPSAPRPKEKPKGLKATAVTLCIFSLAGIPTVKGVVQGEFASILTFAVLMGLWLLVIWLYWLGRNWARWVMIIGSLLSFVGLFYFPERSYDRVYVVLDAMYGLFLLYWLNSKPVREYFANASDARIDALEAPSKPS